VRRASLLILCIAGLAALLVAPAAQARKHTPPRKGGKVTLAWPKTTKGTAGRVPKSALARWLARQVGPTKLKPKKRKTTLPAANVRRSIAATAASATGAPATDAAVATTPNFVPDGSPEKLQLMRSFDIPADDPAYTRLENLSFTYDSAIAAISFTGAKNTPQAAMLLDQLAALQRTDGSLDLAYNTVNGDSARLFRTGTVAWVGLAAVIYKQQTGSKAYDGLAAGAAKWILTQQGEDGLLRGGPDVKWVSTQNNIIAAQFLSQYSGSGQTNFRKQGKIIGEAVTDKLLVDDNHFIQGTGDNVQPADVQALGALLLQQQGEKDKANQVLTTMIENDRVGDVSIALSKDRATYNMTYEAKGPFTGMRPYAEKDAPDLIWFEWTVQARVAMDRLGFKDPELAASMDAWTEVTAPEKQGPLGASATASDERYNEFHVWPASAAGSWLLLQQTKPSLILPTSGS